MSPPEAVPEHRWIGADREIRGRVEWRGCRPPISAVARNPASGRWNPEFRTSSRGTGLDLAKNPRLEFRLVVQDGRGCNLPLSPHVIGNIITGCRTRDSLVIDFVFMLTRKDRTILDCLDVFGEIGALGLRHVGFKDIGADFATLRKLTSEIRSTGAVSYLEVVSTSDDACLRSARAAVELGVDRLLGGTNVESVLAVTQGSGVSYFPFPFFVTH